MIFLHVHNTFPHSSYRSDTVAEAASESSFVHVVLWLGKRKLMTTIPGHIAELEEPADRTGMVPQVGAEPTTWGCVDLRGVGHKE